MKKVLPYVAIGLLALYAYYQNQRISSAPQTDDEVEQFASLPAADEGIDEEAPSSFSCDGRVYCSEMTSCAEAEYFLENCPGVKMDGGGDGVPCERQWCGNR